MSNNKLSGGLQLNYLENFVEGILRPKPEVFYRHTTSQILPFADVREPAVAVDVTDAYELLRQNV